MKASIEVIDDVILRCHKGDTYLQDIIDSWNELFLRFDNLKVYKGVVSDFLEATTHHEDKNMNLLVDYLREHMGQIENMKIAVVMDTPHVTNTILLGQKMKHLQIRPFATRKAAFEWVNI